MTVRFRPLAAVTAAAMLVVGFAACDRGPENPIRPGPPPTPPTPPTTPVSIVRLDLVGPTEIAPHESVQLTLNAVKTDGSVENVTAQANWTSTVEQVVS